MRGGRCVEVEFNSVHSGKVSDERVMLLEKTFDSLLNQQSWYHSLSTDVWINRDEQLI